MYVAIRQNKVSSRLQISSWACTGRVLRMDCTRGGTEEHAILMYSIHRLYTIKIYSRQPPDVYPWPTEVDSQFAFCYLSGEIGR